MSMEESEQKLDKSDRYLDSSEDRWTNQISTFNYSKYNQMSATANNRRFQRLARQIQYG